MPGTSTPKLQLFEWGCASFMFYVYGIEQPEAAAAAAPAALVNFSALTIAREDCVWGGRRTKDHGEYMSSGSLSFLMGLYTVHFMVPRG